MVTLRWTTAGRRSRSQALLVTSAHEGQELVPCPAHPGLEHLGLEHLGLEHLGLEHLGQIARRWGLQDGVEVLLQVAPLARQGRGRQPGRKGTVTLETEPAPERRTLEFWAASTEPQVEHAVAAWRHSGVGEMPRAEAR
ncbi:hypothetical protein SQ03_01910 [Methylobacterium platani JCM 14648]|uniref:Uncharacterized protein n=2 Tax=Methylobacterium platani TaxID=427683 RepID=A0A179SHS3_9HYPH|nr:hypothetical protein SQ03_01910 [Methylobacterium platani JCM 14648]OAS26090.1 hypothetical protein A5481_06990 [Methylobacterium platani]